MSINLLSINANGLNHPAKRSSLWKTTLSGGYNILCVQETHFVLDNAPQCKHKNFPHVFKADYICKQRGVLIAVRDTLAFSLLQSYIDPGGRYIILVCTLDDINYTIVNVYAPNARQMQFHKVLKKIRELQNGHLLICGDFNLVPDVNRFILRCQEIYLTTIKNKFGERFVWRMEMLSCDRERFYVPLSPTQYIFQNRSVCLWQVVTSEYNWNTHPWYYLVRSRPH